MTRTVRPAPRLRAVASGVVCSVGAMIAHGLAGGAAPGPVALLVLPFAIAVTTLVVRRTGDIVALGAAALLTQLGWHLLLMFGPGTMSAGHGAMAQPGGMAMAGHDHAAMADQGGLPMLAAHLLAATLTVALCLGLERALLQLLADRALRQLAPAHALPVAPRRTGRVATVDVVRPVTAQRALAGVLRGPPGWERHLPIGRPHTG